MRLRGVRDDRGVVERRVRRGARRALVQLGGRTLELVECSHVLPPRTHPRHLLDRELPQVLVRLGGAVHRACVGRGARLKTEHGEHVATARVEGGGRRGCSAVALRDLVHRQVKDDEAHGQLNRVAKVGDERGERCLRRDAVWTARHDGELDDRPLRHERARNARRERTARAEEAGLELIYDRRAHGGRVEERERVARRARRLAICRLAAQLLLRRHAEEHLGQLSERDRLARFERDQRRRAEVPEEHGAVVAKEDLAQLGLHHRRA
mmetsp:Transcript_18574/g.57888  ORF Transcript_18574/g.57888 Transcript_18574/m.57888 type:complete len:267 (-) Transcript_18574:266-1066(-)